MHLTKMYWKKLLDMLLGDFCIGNICNFKAAIFVMKTPITQLLILGLNT